ncbi:2-hydroxychromene-2-carboxylate isomerase [Seongchinamella sediminis]|uniref:2-hydroxychromene-2-carboxylate isomerase n=1 Tax=Seongchinamella sediminis TaxID=2283635 RepID=A0A3L7DZH8_9GAMM|nr:DsbA family protein [Seongchinamella sediminis]RLQ22636.1 2-hydroxychromene-2-carboxylate isomerase [Seongchinamella sediminis]
MAQQFTEQGGAATADPSPLRRWVTSRLLTHIASDSRLTRRRRRLEKQRLRAGKRHRVEYFHQVEDAYSQLLAQVLAAFCQRYDVELVCHLVRGPEGKNVAEPALLLKLSCYDAFHVAPEYGLDFPCSSYALAEESVNLAAAVLASLDSERFVASAAAVGAALWAGDSAALQQIATELGTASPAELQSALDAGTARRAELGHYSGGMLYCAGEWYWGVDRLYHLEKRLRALGADTRPDQPMLVPRPEIETAAPRDNGSLTLEIYPSLRSPYTAIVFDRSLQLAADTGVNLVVRPVLPMVMRGVPATREKGFYIFADVAREAREAGWSWGRFYDPIGEPVRRCYSLYPWAVAQGRGNALLSCFLRAAFVDGVNTNTRRGLRRVVEAAGLDWRQAEPRIGSTGWEEMLEENRLAMYAAGLWGVPSFRLLDANGEGLLSLWGQDRLWLVAREIQRQLAARGANR